MTTMEHFVDPKAHIELKRLASSGEPPLETLSPVEARRLADQRVKKNGWEAMSMHAVQDLTLAGPGGALTVRLYRPTEAKRPPLIMFFHGGGFMVGSLDTHDGLCRMLAGRTGAAVLAVDYRLAPEHRFPAAPEDCLFATRWAVASARELNIDAGRIAVVGESSGGNLAAGIAQALSKKGAPTLALQVLIYPSLDLMLDFPSYQRFAEGYFFTLKKAVYFKDHYLSTPGEALDARASPLRASSVSGLCPTLIIAAGLDPMIDEAEAYANRLREAKVKVKYQVMEGWPHGFLFWGHTEVARAAMDRVVGELVAAFGTVD